MKLRIFLLAAATILAVLSMASSCRRAATTTATPTPTPNRGPVRYIPPTLPPPPTLRPGQPTPSPTLPF